MAQEVARTREQALLQLLQGALGHQPACDSDEEERILRLVGDAGVQLAVGVEGLGLVDTEQLQLQAARALVPDNLGGRGEHAASKCGVV